MWEQVSLFRGIMGNPQVLTRCMLAHLVKRCLSSLNSNYCSCGSLLCDWDSTRMTLQSKLTHSLSIIAFYLWPQKISGVNCVVTDISKVLVILFFIARNAYNNKFPLKTFFFLSFFITFILQKINVSISWVPKAKATSCKKLIDLVVIYNHFRDRSRTGMKWHWK